ncbi:hypothetical protein KAR91_10640 [Candidatus Pacearchaeota archaeon]|nr:hypothetical protein [Candidatus Pacearchaeota archaeon]
MKKWYKFQPCVPGNRQKLPPEKKYVLVCLDSAPNGPHANVVGYLKFATGDKSSPQFITPGVPHNRPRLTLPLKSAFESLDEYNEYLELAEHNMTAISNFTAVLYWCDCLPEDFEYKNEKE